jgi:AmiR/NasT family two-component response regulator
MSQSLRIAVADDDAVMRLYFQKILPRLGHEVVALVATGRELVEQCRSCRPDLVITDYLMPDLNGIEAAILVGKELAVPIILITGTHDPDLLGQPGAENVLSHVAKPVRQNDLAAAIDLTMRRFAEIQVARRAAGASPQVPDMESS